MLEILGTLLVLGLLVLFIGIPIFFICKTPPAPEPVVDYSRF